MGYFGAAAPLGQYAGNRDNNLNLIRAIAATAVLVSHAHPIALGPGAPEPLVGLLGHSLGSLAVDAFFVISGFLIAGSFEHSRSRVHFITARVLRLYPALIVSLLGVAFLLGPLATSLSVPAYLSDGGVYTFMVRNLALIVPQYTLPGVFETNPYPTVEGSIWTLFYEVACYVGIFLLGVLGLLARRGVMAGLIAGFVGLWLAVEILEPALHRLAAAMIDLALPFAIGTAFYLWRARLLLSLWGVIALAVLTWAMAATPAYTLLLTLTLGYAVFWAGYVPGGWIRAYNGLGDYSYGIYIYAFPMQGAAIWLFGPMGPVENMIIAMALTLPPSILSWHLIEKPALDRRTRIADWLLGARRAPRSAPDPR